MKLNKLIYLSLPLLALSACGGNKETPKHVHEYSEISWQWTKNSYTYDVIATYSCATCNETFSQVAVVNEDIKKEATCTEDGQREYIAYIELDGEEYSDSKIETIDKTGHKAHGDWITDETSHYKTCEYCGEHMEEGLHEFGDWETVTEASLGVEGLKERECEVCHYVEQGTIPAIYPTVDEVQAAVNKVVASKVPYSYNYALSVKELYSYLSADDKALISNYDRVTSDITRFEDSYVCVSDVNNRTVRKTDSEGLNYAGTWEGETSKDKDNVYYDVDVLDIKTVGTGWGGQHYNGVSFEQDSVDLSECNTIEFAIYNPNTVKVMTLLYTDGWCRVPDEATIINLQPGWNDLSFTVKDGGYNSTTGYTDITLDDFSIIIMEHQVIDGWMISSIYGKKTSNKEVLDVIDLIDALPSANEVTADDKEAIENARAAYDALNDSAKAKVTNYDKLVAVEEAYCIYIADEVIDLIDSFPTTFDLFKTFAVLDEVGYKYDALTAEAKALVTNYSTYQSIKSDFDQHYSVIYNPRTAAKLSHGGNDTDTLETSKCEYGPCLKINVTDNVGIYQTYTFGFPTTTYSSTSVLNFKIFTPFETIQGTSQSFWAGSYNPSYVVPLTGNGWTTISKTGDQLSNDGRFTTYINEAGASFLNLQRYDGAGALTTPYSGSYLMTAIIATK